MTQAIIDELLELHATVLWRVDYIGCKECCWNHFAEDLSDNCLDIHNFHNLNPNNRCETVQIITKEKKCLE